ncbi:MAG: DUF2812 domain-containing protein [Candidatus Izemoplasmatales bacterium]
MRKYKWLLTPWTSSSIERYENLLESQALSGWIIQKTSLCFLFSQFAKTEPAHIRYCLDYHHKVNVDYRTIMTDDGWTLVNMANGWYLWKKGYNNERPSIFTDKQSLIDRNHRLLLFHGIILITQIPVFLIFLKTMTESPSLPWTFLTCFYFLILIILGISTFSLLIVNSKLKNK